jgi:hypothetical protein
MSGVTEIIPHLWLGDLNSAFDIQFLTKKQIQVVINCSDTTDYPTKPLISHRYNLSLKDTSTPTVIAYYCTLLHEALQNQCTCLIYCQTGNHRAPRLMLAYLVKYTHIEPEKVLSLLTTKRPDIDITLS